jgi:hypothetical protein
VVSFFKDLAIWIVPTNARLYLLDLLGGGSYHVTGPALFFL